MCGIIGYAGCRDAAPLLVQGLRRLEYRGYDSAGLAVLGTRGIELVRAVGRVAALAAREQPSGAVGIGHTRWATHGAPSERNAHPHADCSGDFAVVHNGIIENHEELRAELEARGHTFQSETDTEVVAHLLEDEHQGDLVGALRAVVERLRGSYALAIVSRRDPGSLVVARNRSPLLVGLGAEGTLVASDATPLLEHTRSVVYLRDGEIARLTQALLQVFDEHGKPVDAKVETIDWPIEEAELGGFPHFMLKEIHEIPRALHDALRGRVHDLGRRLDLEGSLDPDALRRCERAVVLACGTSYNAGAIGKSILEDLAGVPCDVQLASEFRYAKRARDARALAILVSQSGETADTLEAMRKARELGYATLAITNVAGSSITREADGVLQMRAGPEISVAATKTFTNTLAVFYQLAVHLGALRGHLRPAEVDRCAADLQSLPRLAERALDLDEEIQRLAQELLVRERSAFFLGRQLFHGVSLEAALKLKEIAYVHAEGYAAGELKHGPLALIEPGVPVIACAPQDATYAVMMSNLREVRAREARVLAIVEEDDVDATKTADHVLRLPRCDARLFPVPAIVALYLLAYHAARLRGCEIDRPRNLAKSVTVE